MKTSRFNILFLLIASFFGGSCAIGCSSTKFIVLVDAIATPESKKFRSYFLMPAKKEISLDDLQFCEYAEQLNRALEMSGFVKSNDIDHSDLVILVDYEISKPKENIFSYSVPHYGQTGIASSTTSGTVQSYGRNSASYSGTTNYTPSYGITGYSSHVGTYVTYKRSLTLVAIDTKTFKKKYWQVIAVSEGSSGDLRMVFPYLVIASQPYLGKSTNKQAITVELDEDDDNLIWIRDGKIKQSKEGRWF